MFTRTRWFLLGSATTLAATAVVVTKARSMKEQLTAEGIARISAALLADGLEGLGVSLQRSALREVPPPSEPSTG